MAVVAITGLSCTSEVTREAGHSNAPGSNSWRGIINGSPAIEKRFDAVVQLYYQYEGYDWWGLCSGTLITDTVVLTAAHCVYVKDCQYNPRTGLDENCQLETDASRFRVYVHKSEHSSDVATRQFREVTDVHAHPEYNPDFYVRYDAEDHLNDIALLRIENPFSAVTPIPALPNEPGLAWTEADVGVEVTFVGFGVTETGDSGTRLYVNDDIDEVCLTETPCDMAAPKMVCNVMNNGLTCNGDSGGPLLIERNGIFYNGGVTAYGLENCVLYGCSMAVSSYADWIAEYLGGNDLPNGSECIGNGQCQSGICTLGVCCDRVCTGAPCEACSRARGASSDGVCGWAVASCDDGNPCTEGDFCVSGTCRSGWQKSCASGDQCNLASVCDTATGGCLPNEPKPDGTSCNDGNACSLEDRCVRGMCISEGSVYCLPPGECQQTVGGGCNQKTGLCMYEDLPDGTLCGDGRAKCQSGACVKPSSGGGCGAAGEKGFEWVLIFGLIGLNAFHRFRMHS